MKYTYINNTYRLRDIDTYTYSTQATDIYRHAYPDTLTDTYIYYIIHSARWFFRSLLLPIRVNN